jgi:hypothetical protein
MGVLTGIAKSTKSIETDINFQNGNTVTLQNGNFLIGRQLLQAVINVFPKD